MNLKSAPATILLGVVGLVLLTALGWVALIGPALGALGDAGDAKVEAEDRNQMMALQLAKLNQQAEDLPRTTDLAQDLDAMFPPTADQPEFFAQVKDAAARSGLTPNDVTTLSVDVPLFLDAAGEPIAEEGAPESPDAEPTSDVAVQHVEIVAEGTFEQLTELMSRLESMDRAFLIDTATVGDEETGETGETGESITLSVTGSTYVATPLGKAPSGER